MTRYAYRDVSRLGPYREDPVRHYGLAMEIAREFFCSGLERSDIEQEALTVLCAAARTFDPDRGHAFSTWAGRLIRNHLSGVVHLYRRVGMTGGRNARGLSLRLRRHLRDGGSCAAGTVRELLRTNRHWAHPTDWDCFVAASLYLYPEVSLDETWDHREGVDSPAAKIPRHETVEDPRLLQDIEERMSAGDIERAVEEALGSLRPREREIVTRRVIPDLVGEGDTVPTMQEIADDWGVTRQRVQQIEADAMEKLQRYLSRA